MADGIDVAAETAKVAESVTLAIGGVLWGGWKSVSVTRSLDTVTGTFELTLAPRDPAINTPFPIRAGDACRVLIAGETVIDGYVDRVGLTKDATDNSISVSGRDRTGDLADCSAIAKPGTWRNTKVEAIAAELAKPFGISVTAKADTGKPIVKFALQQGEDVHAAIERLLRFRGLLMTTAGDGNLQIIAPDQGAPVLTLEMGVNIKSIAVTTDMSGRFSSYLVKGQAAGSDDANGKTMSQISGTATDSGVKRYRPLLVVAEEQGDGASLKARAAWEAGVRAGKSVSAEITVLGWRVAAGGKLWAPNIRVRVKAPAEQIDDQQMLVSAVTLSSDDGGTSATLTVMPPAAWTQLATSETSK